MNPTEQQYDPDAAGAPCALAIGLAAISSNLFGWLHFRCKRCGHVETQPVADLRRELTRRQFRELKQPTCGGGHTCPDGGWGITALCGGMLNLEQRNREALERIEKK